MRHGFMWVTMLAGLAMHLPPATATGAEPAERRLMLIRAAEGGAAALPVLKAGLTDPNVVVRRTAARLLGEVGTLARDVLTAALANDDSVVRQAALKGLLGIKTADHVAVLRTILDDSDLVLRLIAVRELAATRPQTDAVKGLLSKAAKDSADAVRSVASRALWPFSRHVVPLRERSDWDHDVEVVSTISLPKENWRFRLDPQRDGHLRQWHELDFDDTGWDGIAIEQAWQKAGYEHTGVAWYRRWVELPAKPEGKVNAVEIAFAGVDECAWVWLNGVYVGEHDVGPSGWDKPFTLDVSDAIAWGKRNQITVRAMNTAHAGGIWRPVRLEVLR